MSWFHRIDGLYIGASITELLWVSTHFQNQFKDIWWISTQSIKTQLSNGIECHSFLQVCLGNDDMSTIPKLLVRIVLKILLSNAKIALLITKKNPSYEYCQNRKWLIHGLMVEWCPSQYSYVMIPIEPTCFHMILGFIKLW